MIRAVTIKAALNGWIVDVGCQTLAFESTTSLLLALDGYLRNPEGYEKNFLATALNRAHTYPSSPVPDEPLPQRFWNNAQISGLAALVPPAGEVIGSRDPVVVARHPR